MYITLTPLPWKVTEELRCELFDVATQRSFVAVFSFAREQATVSFSPASFKPSAAGSSDRPLLLMRVEGVPLIRTAARRRLRGQQRHGSEAAPAQPRGRIV